MEQYTICVAIISNTALVYSGKYDVVSVLPYECTDIIIIMIYLEGTDYYYNYLKPCGKS